jgi:hypothetical protein
VGTKRSADMDFSRLSISSEETEDLLTSSHVTDFSCRRLEEESFAVALRGSVSAEVLSLGVSGIVETLVTWAGPWI